MKNLEIGTLLKKIGSLSFKVESQRSAKIFAPNSISACKNLLVPGLLDVNELASLRKRGKIENLIHIDSPSIHYIYTKGHAIGGGGDPLQKYNF